MLLLVERSLRDAASGVDAALPIAAAPPLPPLPPACGWPCPARTSQASSATAMTSNGGACAAFGMRAALFGVHTQLEAGAERTACCAARSVRTAHSLPATSSPGCPRPALSLQTTRPPR